MSNIRRVGLPDSLRMRHDTHFVEQLVRPSGEPVGRLVLVTEIDPNPNQPRQSMGDLSELTASIREKGIIEPILVRRIGTRYQIIAGERRYRAAMDAGLPDVPCIIRDVGEAEMMELALIENLQREDLSPFDEADGLRVLAEKHAYTHEKIAEVLGRSRSTITESLALSGMPEEVRQLCRLADIGSKSLLLQVVRQATPAKMAALVERLQAEGETTRTKARAIAREQKGKTRGRPRNYVFRYAPKEKSFNLSLQFKKSQVARDEIVRALQAIIEELTSEES